MSALARLSKEELTSCSVGNITINHAITTIGGADDVGDVVGKSLGRLVVSYTGPG